jgi:hypothetical protein
VLRSDSKNEPVQERSVTLRSALKEAQAWQARAEL